MKKKTTCREFSGVFEPQKWWAWVWALNFWVNKMGEDEYTLAFGCGDREVEFVGVKVLFASLEEIENYIYQTFGIEVKF